MSYFKGLKLTKLGETLLANINGNLNETLTFTSGEIGAGIINSDDEIRFLTTLKEKWKDLDIISIEKDEKDETIVKLELQFSNIDLKEAKIFREIGIYAKGNNGEPVLFAYSNAGENYDYIPLPQDNPQNFTIEINLKITSNSKIDAIINMAGFVTIGKMIEYLKNKLTQISTIAELQSRKNLKVGDIVEVLGYYKTDDGAGHKRIIANEDDGSGVQLNNKLWANVIHNGEVNVSWFGAKGDGVTDCSHIFQKILNYSQYNCDVFVSKGTYIVKNVALPQHSHIKGLYHLSKLMLPVNANTGDCIFLEASDSFGNIIIENLFFDGNKEKLSSNIICNGLVNGSDTSLQNTKYSNKYRNIVVHNFSGSGAKFDNDMMECVFENVLFKNNNDCGIYFKNIMDSKMILSNFAGNKNHGLYMNNGSTFKIVNCKAYLNGNVNNGSGMTIFGIGNEMSAVEIQENYFDGIVFTNCSAGNFEIISNNNNHTNAQNCSQVKVKDSSYNKFNIAMFRGTLLMANREILEKIGLYEEGTRNFANNYNITDGHMNILGFRYKNNMEIIKSDCISHVNNYIVNGKNYYTGNMSDNILINCNSSNDSINPYYSFKEISSTYKRNVKKTDNYFDITLSIDNTVNKDVHIERLMIHNLYKEKMKDIKIGDKLYISYTAKNNLNAKLTIFAQIVVDGKYINLKRIYEIPINSTNYDYGYTIYEIPEEFVTGASYDMYICFDYKSFDKITGPIDFKYVIKDIRTSFLKEII